MNPPPTRPEHTPSIVLEKITAITSAIKCYFYSDGNQYRQPHRVPIAWDRYRSLNSLLQDLTGKVTDLRYGVRAIFTPRGRHRISSLEQLKNEGDYVCSDNRTRAKGVDIYGIHVSCFCFGKVD